LNPGLILASAAVAFIVATTFMLALRPVAFSIGLVDAPGGRKLHVGDIPITGGIAMFMAIVAGSVLLPIPGNVMLSIFIASAILVTVGVVDDRFHISAVPRLLSQIIAVLLMYFGAGFFLADIGDPFGTGLLHTGSLSLILTMLVFVAMINAYNFVDGADGLAGSLSLIGLLSVAVVCGLFHPIGALALTVSAAIAGFLVFNFPTIYNRPVRSFMGDAGSTLLGFTLAWIVLSISQGPDRVISPVYGLWFAALPIFDFFTCFVRRLRKGKSPFAPGRDHYHHILMRGGFGVRQTLGILTALQTVYALIGLAAAFGGTPDIVMFTAWSILGITQVWVIRAISKYHRLYLRYARRRSGSIVS